MGQRIQKCQALALEQRDSLALPTGQGQQRAEENTDLGQPCRLRGPLDGVCDADERRHEAPVARPPALRVHVVGVVQGGGRDEARLPLHAVVRVAVLGVQGLAKGVRDADEALGQRRDEAPVRGRAAVQVTEVLIVPEGAGQSAMSTPKKNRWTP